MNELQFSDMDSWKGSGNKKQFLTYNQIILMHINRCVINGSNEWKGGYWEENTRIQGSGIGVLEKRYIPSTVEVYVNSVRQLRALLIGYFDNKMREADLAIQEEIKQLKPKDNISKTNLSIRLFEELVMLLKRLNFFEEISSEEEI